MLTPDSPFACRRDHGSGVLALDIDGDIVLLGMFGAFLGFPAPLFRDGVASMLLQRLASRPPEMLHLRTFLARRILADGLSRLPDSELVQLVTSALRSHRLEALAVRGGYTATYQGPGLAVRSSARSPDLSRDGLGELLKPDDPTLAKWLPEKRVAEVIRRTIEIAPTDLVAEFRTLLSPEYLIQIIESIAFVEIVDERPYHWLDDGAVAGIALAFGGLAGIHALGDLIDCFRKVAIARNLRDLQAASEPLACVLAALGVRGLMAVLHKSAARRKESAPTASGEFASTRELVAAHAERMKARVMPPSLPAPPPPELTILPRSNSELTWISIELQDQDQKPVAGERYLLRLPDFSELDGRLDAAGQARVDGIIPGTCQVCFPDIDAREWFSA